jgi:hemerythrin-like domain-containing protein
MNSSDPAEMSAITDFSQCHMGILSKLDMLGELPALLEPARRARDIAERAIDFFQAAIFEHHQDEERELFPAVIRDCQKGEELDRVQAMVHRLTEEHRSLEKLWKTLEPGLKRVAQGKSTDLQAHDIQLLVTQYAAHARYEEQEFLPLSQVILGRNSNHMSALGLSLHIRHAHPGDIATYI